MSRAIVDKLVGKVKLLQKSAEDLRVQSNEIQEEALLICNGDQKSAGLMLSMINDVARGAMSPDNIVIDVSAKDGSVIIGHKCVKKEEPEKKEAASDAE
jgi:hypothetical protein